MKRSNPTFQATLKGASHTMHSLTAEFWTKLFFSLTLNKTFTPENVLKDNIKLFKLLVSLSGLQSQNSHQNSVLAAEVQFLR